MTAVDRMTGGNRMTDDQRLTAMLDSEDIRALITRFGRCQDERRWANYAALFTEDGVLELPFGSWTGPGPISAQVESDLAVYVATHHVSTNHDVELDGDSALARVTFIATHVTSADGMAFWRGGGVYRFELRRVDGTWRIARVTIDPVWRSAIGTAFPEH
jgi:uncharacterized protein (TIGR02246 family)